MSSRSRPERKRIRRAAAILNRMSSSMCEPYAMTTMAFIGLGVMGAPMAGHLASAGHDVRVYNRSAPKAQQWADRHRGVVAANPGAAAAGADAVFLCVGNDDDVRHVVLGPEGVLAALDAGATIVDHTTASATLA